MIADALWHRIKAALLVAGMEDALARQFDEYVEPGFLRGPAEHLWKHLARSALEAESAEKTLASYLDANFGFCGYVALAHPLRELQLG